MSYLCLLSEMIRLLDGPLTGKEHLLH